MKYSIKDYQDFMPESCGYKQEAIESNDYCWGIALEADEGIKDLEKTCKGCEYYKGTIK